MRQARSLLLYLVPAILCVNAVAQRYLAENHDLNPWKGGGFGMFADLPPYRVLRIVPVDENDIGYQTPPPEKYRRHQRTLGILPSEGRLQSFAERLAAEDWVLVGLDKPSGQQYPVLAEESDEHSRQGPIELKGVIVEMFEYRFDPETDLFQITALGKERADAPGR